MTGRDSWKTADEILSSEDTRRCQAERRADLQQKEARFRANLAPLMRELRDIGYPADSIEDLVEKYAPLPENAVCVLLSWLNRLTIPNVQDSVLRALGTAATPFDGRPLTACFESLKDTGFEWTIMNTIAMSRPLYIEEWIADLRKDSYWNQTLRDLGFDSRRKPRQ